MTGSRATAGLLFGATLLGALAPSFAHVAEWWQAMVPPSAPWLAWIAALVIEGSLFAALFGLAVVKPGTKGRRWVVALLLLGAGASTYANLAWSLRQRGIGAESILVSADVLFGAALLPLYAVVTAHAAPHVFARCRPGPDTLAKSRAVRTARPDARPPDTLPELARKPGRKSRRAAALASIAAGEYDQHATQADLARAFGVAESTVSRWPIVRTPDGWRIEDDQAE